MKTLYYKINFKFLGKSYDTGFIVVRSDDEGRFKNIEGILTLDYLCARIIGKYLVFEYYEKKWALADLKLKCKFAIETKDVKIPLNFDFETKEFEMQLRTIDTVMNSEIQVDYERRIHEFRKKNGIDFRW